MGSAAGQSEGGTSLAVLPIVVHSADDPQFLRDGLADMLASRLEQAGGFEVIRVDDPAAMTTRLSEAVEAGRAANADYVLFGSFTRFGTGASLDMQCASTSGDSETPILREIFVHSGSIGDVIPDLDALVGKLGRFAHLHVPANVDVSVAPEGAPSTPEIEALRLRLSALEAGMLSLQEQADAVGTSGPDVLSEDGDAKEELSEP